MFFLQIVENIIRTITASFPAKIRKNKFCLFDRQKMIEVKKNPLRFVF